MLTLWLRVEDEQRKALVDTNGANPNGSRHSSKMNVDNPLRGLS